MGSGASTASVGYVNNGLTNTNPGYAVKIQLVSSSVQTDPWQPLEGTKAPFVDDAAVIDLAKLGARGDHHGGTGGKDKTTPEDTWLQVCETLDVPKGHKFNDKSLIQNRTGWKTIRVFVSSTFRDFMHEREVLVKQVFPDLRAWCEKRRLHLVDCDLRWGIPKDTTTESTLRMCLGEIDRCYQDNIMPYFLNMTSERIGWIPLPNEVPPNLVDEYRWIFGLSVTEMEIVHGAYRKDNPNSLFVWRDDDFLQSVPEKHRSVFVDDQAIAPAKLKMLRKMIEERFPAKRVIKYNCEYDGVGANGKISLKLDSSFAERIFDFFKDRISLQYPLIEKESDPFEIKREAHEAFLKSKAESVLGRDALLKQIYSYIGESGGDVPLLILGGPGTGKSSIMAKAADETHMKAVQGALGKPPVSGYSNWHVFYHFVGAVPGSTEVLYLIQRLLRDLGVEVADLPTDLESAVQSCCSTLNNPGTKPVIIFIDALNQLDEDVEAQLMNWIPRKLAPQIRCIFALINDTPQHKNLMARESKPKEVFVKPLDLTVRKDIICEILGKYNKKLDMDQIISLLTKSSSENPLWLSIACEELRVFGQFRQVSDKINGLADGLLELLQQVLTRFEQEGGGHLLKAAMCLLEVSSHGLLESELLEILADEDNLMLPESGKEKEKGEKESSEKGFKSCGQLPAFKWSAVYRSLRTFLRPFGDSGEGRLDFYHRSLSKAVRKKYLQDGTVVKDDELNVIYKWWHKKLADYFDWTSNYDRKVEEYPYHLIKLNDTNRFEKFLTEWEVFDRLFDKEHSGTLLKYWSKCGGNQRMMERYSENLQTMKDENVDKNELGLRYEQVARVLVQAGEYKQANEMSQVALKMEEEELGKRTERIASIYCLLALIKDQKVKLHEFCSVSQIPEIRDCLVTTDTALDYLSQIEDQSSREHKRTIGMFLVKKAFNLANFADCRGDSEMTVDQAIAQGEKTLLEAIKIFEEINDIGHKAEAVMTQAVLCRYDFNKQVKYYSEALELCKQAYGDYHILTGRIHMNWGIVYEDDLKYEMAYTYFRQNYLIQLEVLGPEHVRTKRAQNILNEPTYIQIATRLGHDIPDPEPGAEIQDIQEIQGHLIDPDEAFSDSDTTDSDGE